MVKEVLVNMGINLGFIEKITLTDGTVLTNGQVLYSSPVPNKMQFRTIFNVASEVSRNVFGPATPEWSDYPELEQGRRYYEREVLS